MPGATEDNDEYPLSYVSGIRLEIEAEASQIQDTGTIRSTVTYGQN